eukprot:gene16273-19308_t
MDMDGCISAVEYDAFLLRDPQSHGGGLSSYVGPEALQMQYVSKLFNPSCTVAALDEYALLKTINGGEVDTLQLAGTLGPGEIYNMCDANMETTCDLQVGFISHNGDDGMALTRHGIVVDVLGVLGERVKWDVAGVRQATKDHTLVRKATVSQGTTDWAASAGTNYQDSEWTVYAKDTLDFLLCHTATSVCDASRSCGVPPPPRLPPNPMIPAEPSPPPHPLYPPYPPGDAQVNSSSPQAAGVQLAEAVSAYYVDSIQLSSSAALEEALPVVERALAITGDTVQGAGQHAIDAQGLSGILILRGGGNVTLTNVALVNGSAAFGAAAWVGAATRLALLRCHVANHRTDNEGTIYAAEGSAVVYLTDTFFESNSAAKGGSVLYAMLSNSSVELSNSRLEGNEGSALQFSGCGTVAISTCDLSRNEAAGNGAAVAWSECEAGGALTLVDSYFGLNRAAGYGGALNLFQFADGAVDIVRSAFIDNVATAVACEGTSDVCVEGSGGAVGSAGCSGGRIHVEASLLRNNSAEGRFGNGGAVQVVDGLNRLNLVESVLIANVADRNGGGVYLRGETVVEVWNTTIRGCTASFGHQEEDTDDPSGGGGIYMYSAIRLSIAGHSQLTENRGLLGGGVYVDFTIDVVTIEDTVLSSNVAGRSNWDVEQDHIHKLGGAVYCQGGALVIAGSRFENNTAGDSDNLNLGGAVHHEDGVLNISQTEFTGNALVGNHESKGTALYAGDGTMTLAEVWVTRHGACSSDSCAPWDGDWAGAIVLIYAEVSLRDCEFSQNTLGAMMLQQTSGAVTGMSFHDNSARAKDESEHPWTSGAALLSRWANTTVTHSRFEGNVAVSGGAVYAYGSNLAVEHCAFLQNNADFGGAIAMTKDLTGYDAGGYFFLHIEDSAFEGNLASDDGANGNGGAVMVEQSNQDGVYMTVTIVRTYFSRNYASSNGGAFWLGGTVPSIVDCRVISNRAEVQGGGGVLWNIGDGDAFLGGSKLSNNTAVYAGGIAVGPSITITDGTLIANNSAHDAGGVAMREDEYRVVLEGRSKVTGNTAESNGGGMNAGSYSSAIIMVRNGTEVSFNQAVTGGGIYASSNASLLIQDSRVRANVAWGSGGGVHVSSGGRMFASNGTSISDNMAVGGSGGGLFVDASSVEMSACEVMGNMVDGGDGGGLFGIEADVDVLCGTKISNNTAWRFGGGVYLANGSIALRGESRLDGNTAGVFGGGAYFKESDVLISEGTLLTGNAAKYEGASVSAETCQLEVWNASLRGGSTGGLGGGMLASRGSVLTMQQTNVTNCIADLGGALAILDSIAHVEACRLEDNRVTGQGFSKRYECSMTE